MIVEARLAEERKRRTNKKFVKIKNSRKTPHVNPSIQFQDSVDGNCLPFQRLHDLNDKLNHYKYFLFIRRFFEKILHS